MIQRLFIRLVTGLVIPILALLVAPVLRIAALVCVRAAQPAETYAGDVLALLAGIGGFICFVGMVGCVLIILIFPLVAIFGDVE